MYVCMWVCGYVAMWVCGYGVMWVRLIDAV